MDCDSGVIIGCVALAILLCLQFLAAVYGHIGQSHRSRRAGRGVLSRKMFPIWSPEAGGLLRNTDGSFELIEVVEKKTGER
jgi:hypothetical protein